MKCDVIIPYHKANLRWLVSSVDSILNQAACTCIIHLIADGFEDEDDPALRYRENDQVRLYRNLHSIGPYRTTNRMFNYLETDFIAIQDSDDIALPNRIGLSLAKLKRDKAEMFGASMMQFATYEDRSRASIDYVYQRPIHNSTSTGKWQLSPLGIVINGTRVMSKDLFDRMNGFAPYLLSSDCELTTRCYLAGVKVSISDEIVSLRRVHATSLSRCPETGWHSKVQEECHNAISKSYRRMGPGFDPKEFGYMDVDLRDCGDTIKLN